MYFPGRPPNVHPPNHANDCLPDYSFPTDLRPWTTPQSLSVSILSPDGTLPTMGTTTRYMVATTADKIPRNTGLPRKSYKPSYPRSGPLSQGSITGHFVFDSSMKSLTPRRLLPRSQADKDAALKLKQMGGACQKHRANKKKASRPSRKHRLALTLSQVSLSFTACDNWDSSCGRNCVYRYCYASYS
jgi:hypothetical protein